MSQSERTKRIYEEFNTLKNSKYISIVKCEFKNGDINNWDVFFEGSTGSPYEDGIFHVLVKLPPGFPQERPYLYFQTKMFHPNIKMSDGLVSLNLMYEWASIKTTIERVFYGVIEIMEDPSPDRGHGEEPQQLLKKDRDQFFKKVLEYTYKYAMSD